MNGGSGPSWLTTLVGLGHVRQAPLLDGLRIVSTAPSEVSNSRSGTLGPIFLRDAARSGTTPLIYQKIRTSDVIAADLCAW